MDNRAFYTVFLAFFSGVFYASYFHASATFFFIVLIIASPFLLSPKKYLLYLLCLLFFCLGAWRLEVTKTNYHPLDGFLDKSITLRGFVSSEPEMKDTGQRFYLKPDEYNDKLLVKAPLFPRYGYGDVLEVAGKLELPENFETYPGGPLFDYVSYLSKDGVRYTMSRVEVRNLSLNRGNFVVSSLMGIKKSFMANIEANMREPHAALVAGILLGEKGSLPKELQEDFRRTGLTHILVLSGSNVSIVAESLMNIFSFLPRALGQSMGAFSIILFAVMTGASATTVRASIMALIVIMSRRAGRNYNVSRALILAAFFMIIHNPRILSFDVGFQLSFLSTLALVCVSPIISEKLEWVTERFQFRGILATTISTQLFILPFMLYRMGEVSVISLITNILVLPIVPWSMFLGFMTGLAAFFGRWIALPFSFFTDVLLSWMISVVSLFGPVPFASIKLSIGEPMLVVVYIFYAWIIWRKLRKNSSLQSAN